MAYSNYNKQSWTDGSGGGTPVSAARLGVMEDGIFNAHYMPSVRVTHNANQSIANNTFTTLAFNTEAFDQSANASDTMHDTVTNNSRLTCRYAGIYVVVAQIEWAASATGQRTLVVNHNTAGQIAVVNQDATAGGGTTMQAVPVIWNFAVNEYVEVKVTQTSGGALNIQASTNVIGPAFSMVRVG